MKPKSLKTFKPKLLLLGFCCLAFLLLLLTSGRSSSPSPPTASAAAQTLACTKLPPSLAKTIVHYTTSNITPQQTLREISVTAKVLERKSPCNFLVFGLGYDSPMWSALNHGGRTVFLEEDESWIKSMTHKFPELEAYHVKYDTRLSQADELLELRRSSSCTSVAAADTRSSACRLALTELPDVFYGVEWDLIMVDAPTGYVANAPGRMSAIYTAGMAARGRSEGETDVFVHDVDRAVEDKFSKTFLCEGYMKEEEGKLRHFTIPSHRANPSFSFCP
ncbi:hypothetical protein BHE74_00047625 [Ensete ventricosum]|uniref:Uncharacterized protein n=1 Tax=Ensete ventricosum TaxID=4639 RepID=A0A444D3T0_ENSVE|nr:hypothetical protein B296_00024282 [Ensete ventricosum]RWV92766.1 hypothetical protein GW17_00044825 [Ensete ventricosum]RWW46448.1 hypothetical protein BHE74_00047625 [Ensete ventricosum]